MSLAGLKADYKVPWGSPILDGAREKKGKSSQLPRRQLLVDYLSDGVVGVASAYDVWKSYDQNAGSACSENTTGGMMADDSEAAEDV